MLCLYTYYEHGAARRCAAYKANRVARVCSGTLATLQQLAARALPPHADLSAYTVYARCVSEPDGERDDDDVDLRSWESSARTPPSQTRKLLLTDPHPRTSM